MVDAYVDTYARNILMDVVRSLATGKEGVKVRIGNAVNANFHVLSENHFKAGEERKLYKKIMAKLTTTEASMGEGQVLASLGAMSEDEGVEVAEWIVELYETVQARIEDEEEAERQAADDEVS